DPAKDERAGEHAREPGRSKSRQTCDTRAEHAKETALDEAERNISRHEEIVELKPTAGRNARDKPAQTSGERQPLEALRDHRAQLRAIDCHATLPEQRMRRMREPHNRSSRQ